MTKLQATIGFRNQNRRPTHLDHLTPQIVSITSFTASIPLFAQLGHRGKLSEKALG